LETEGLSKTLSNPKVFTLNNQLAVITQGQEVPYPVEADGATTYEFKEAALKLEVTPSVVGDGNVLLDIKVNNDSVGATVGGSEPPINKMEIVTKLLVSDGDIVVIGGVKKNTNNISESRTPGLGRVPVLGNLFKSKTKTNNLDELLIFIAPRVI
jgi:type IV pilus assembly protein PilQ